MGLAMLFLCTVPANGQQTPEELYQSALYKQQVEGDLQGAIQILQTLVEDFADHREVAASALVLLGHLHETLGSTSAEQAYRRVLNDYPDQRAAVAAARARLAALTRTPAPAPSNEMVVRRVLSDEDTNGGNFLDMRLSPDGTRAVYTDVYNGHVHVRDLSSGDTTKVADGWAYSPIWSSDGTKVAYGFDPPGDRGKVILTILDLETGQESVPSALQDLSLVPRDWSPDGDLLACRINPADAEGASLGLVSMRTGEITRLAGPQARTFADFSPDGRYVAFSDVVDGNTDVYVMDVASHTRHRITTGADDEALPLWAPSGDVLVYTSANGTWALPMSGSNRTGAAKLLSTEGYQQPAGWTEDGRFFHVRLNVRRRLFQVPLNPEDMVSTGPPEPLPITLMSKATTGFRWSPDMSRIAGLKWDAVDVYSFEDSQIRTYEPVPGFSPLTFEWSRDGSKILFPDLGGRPGAEGTTVVELDLGSGQSRELFPRIGGVAGWLRFSPELEKMAFYARDADSPEMQLVVADFGSPTGVVLADEATMEEGGLSRFVRPQLSPDGSMVLFGTRGTLGRHTGGRNFPYQLWVTAADGSGEPRRIASAYHIPFGTWNSAGTHVAYSTWEDGQQGPGSVYLVEVETGETHEIPLPTGLDGPGVLDWSPDGRWIGLVSTSGSTELLVIENALEDWVG
jgi:Tol biopolymer transport system component